LIARDSPGEYDAWALRWLTRCIAETGASTIEHTAEVAASLAHRPTDYGALDGLLERAAPG
jgi:hypothetical protein